MSKQIKRLWQSVALNSGAVVLNLVIVALSSNPWLWPVNLLAAAVSGYMAYWTWCKIPVAIQEEQERVIKILSGKFS